MEKQKELEERIEVLEEVVAILIVDRAAGINARGEIIKPEELIESAFPADLNKKFEILKDFEYKEILERYRNINVLHKVRRALNIQ